eukprot:413986-Prymnesium_polylepis.1
MMLPIPKASRSSLFAPSTEVAYNAENVPAKRGRVMSPVPSRNGRQMCKARAASGAGAVHSRVWEGREQQLGGKRIDTAAPQTATAPVGRVGAGAAPGRGRTAVWCNGPGHGRTREVAGRCCAAVHCIAARHKAGQPQHRHGVQHKRAATLHHRGRRGRSTGGQSTLQPMEKPRVPNAEGWEAAGCALGCIRPGAGLQCTKCSTRFPMHDPRNTHRLALHSPLARAFVCVRRRVRGNHVGVGPQRLRTVVRGIRSEQRVPSIVVIGLDLKCKGP